MRGGADFGGSLPGAATEVALLPPEYQDLIDAAESARERAYCPYSGFHVGAALLVADEEGRGPRRIVIGANVENASYGGTLCAERSALVKANAEGFRRFRAIAVAARASGRRVDGAIDPEVRVEVPSFTAPCGLCRQVMAEFAQLGDGDFDVLLSGPGDRVWLTSVMALLPGAFGPRDLGVDLARWS